MTETLQTTKHPDWNRITRYYFILCIPVMLAHFSNMDIFYDNRIAWADQIEHFLSARIGALAVAGFFLVSGFLFFRDFSWKKLPVKWKSRVFSLLVPYLAWNLICSVYAFIMANSSFLNRFADAKSVTWKDLLYGVIQCDLYNPVFWYLKYLMIFILLTPVIYLLCKNIYTGLLLIVFLVLQNSGVFHINLPGIGSSCMWWSLYFVLGSFYSLHYSVSLFGNLRRKPRLLLAGACLLYTAGLYLSIRYTGGFAPVFYDFCLIYLLWQLSRILRFRITPLVRNTFFLYASHWLIGRNFNKLICVIFGTKEIYGILAYIILPFLVLGITQVCILLFGRTWLWTVLCGKRGARSPKNS